MVANVFRIHEGLLSARRLPASDRKDVPISAVGVATLLLAGATAAAATGTLHLGLRIPGHAIVLSVLPMTLGLALVPRRLAGVVMSGSAVVTAGALGVCGLGHYGTGSMTSLCLTGPVMDVAVLGAVPGWPLSLRLVAAGFVVNMAAFLQRGASKLFGFERPGTRLLNDWLSEGLLTYTLSGAVAGLIAALCWFQLRSQPSHGRKPRGTADRPMRPSRVRDGAR